MGIPRDAHLFAETFLLSEIYYIFVTDYIQTLKYDIMKRIIWIVSAIFILSAACVLQASAGHILYRISNFNNVSVSSPGLGERYVHAQMVGKYAAMLAEELDYSGKISIGFDYYNPEFSGIDRRFRVSYAEREWHWDKKGEWRKKPVEVPMLNVIQNSHSVDFVDMLKLLEYSILNTDKVKQKQETVVFEREYHGPFETQTLSEAVIDSILQLPTSAVVNKVLANRIYRKDVEKEFTSISYYAQNGKFYVYRDGMPKEEPFTIQEFDHVWQFSPVRYSESVGTYTAVLFDTPGTFRHLQAYDGSYIGSANTGRPAYVSPPHSIGDVNVSIYPCIVRALGRDLVSIVWKDPSMFNPRDRTMIYVIPRDTLILNLEKLLDETENRLEE